RLRFRREVCRGEPAPVACGCQCAGASEMEGGRLLRAEMRAVSLVPSLTETLFALGAGDDVVGITDFCTFPEGIDRPRVGGTKTPDIDRIRELAPDVVYVNIEENLKRHADEIAKFANVVVSEPKTIDDVAQLIEMLGARHGREEA